MNKNSIERGRGGIQPPLAPLEITMLRGSLSHRLNCISLLRFSTKVSGKSKTNVQPSNKATINKGASPTAAGGDANKSTQSLGVLTPLSRKAVAVERLPPKWTEMPICSSDELIRAQIPSELQDRLTKSLHEAADKFGGNYLVWRTELMSRLKMAMDSENQSKIVLDGPAGSGKSAVLLNLFVSLQIAFAHDPNVLLLYAPHASKWTTGYYAYYPSACSTKNVSEYIQPELALEMIRLVLMCNSGKLDSKSIENEVSEAALDPFNRAMPLFERVFSDLKCGGKRLIVLADGVNNLLASNSLTHYKTPEGQRLQLSNLPLCTRFKDLGHQFIGALTYSNPDLSRNPEAVQDNAKGFNCFQVPNYSDSEFSAVLSLYDSLGHTHGQLKSDLQFAGFKAFVSGRNGRLLYKTCEFDSIYFSKELK